MTNKLKKSLSGLGLAGLILASGSAGSALNQSHRQDYSYCDEVITLTDAQYLILREAINKTLSEDDEPDNCWFQIYGLQFDEDFNKELLERNIGPANIEI